MTTPAETGTEGGFGGIRPSVGLAQEAAGILSAISKIRSSSPNGILTADQRAAREPLLGRKHCIVLALLRDPNSGVSGILYRYPGKEIHPFSRNPFDLEFFDSHLPTGIITINSTLNRTAQADETGELNSLGVFHLMERQKLHERKLDPQAYITTTIEEIRQIQKAFGKARRNRDATRCEFLSTLRDHLIDNLLQARATLPPEESMQVVLVGLSLGGDRIWLDSPTTNLIIPVSDNQLRFIGGNGGFDYWYDIASPNGPCVVNPERREIYDRVASMRRRRN